MRVRRRRAGFRYSGAYQGRLHCGPEKRQDEVWPDPGIEPLRQAIVERYAAEYGLKATISQVIVSPGGKFNCYLGVLATCSPGDEVIVPAPFWVSYPGNGQAGRAPFRGWCSRTTARVSSSPRASLNRRSRRRLNC
jgi:histidinol-phosphate/aromatic aminotransferase/cobyric acid decarboxylase-like protein